MEMYDEYVREKYSSTLIKKHYPKFIANIAIIEDFYWLTIN